MTTIAILRGVGGDTECYARHDGMARTVVMPERWRTEPRHDTFADAIASEQYESRLDVREYRFTRKLVGPPDIVPRVLLFQESLSVSQASDAQLERRFVTVEAEMLRLQGVLDEIQREQKRRGADAMVAADRRVVEALP